MKKFLILILSLTFMAASCDITGGLFDLGSGLKGVMKSEDSGETFRTADALVKSGNISGISANSLAFDPKDTKNLYIASSSGIYKSEDAAATWRFVLSGITAADIAVDPYQSNVLYAAGIVGTNGKIIKSIDSGNSWVDIYTEPSKTNPVLSIAVSLTNSSVVIAGLSTGEIIRSLDSGQTWQTAKDFEDRVTKIRFGQNGAIYALTFHKGLAKSTDMGLGWSFISSTLTDNNFSPSNQGISSVTAFYDLGLDKRQVGVLYLGTEQGLYRSVNDGANWAPLSLPVKNASLRTSSVTVNPNNSNNLYAAIASTIFKSVNGGLTWQTKVIPTTSEIRVILMDPQMENLIYLGLAAKR